MSLLRRLLTIWFAIVLIGTMVVFLYAPMRMIGSSGMAGGVDWFALGLLSVLSGVMVLGLWWELGCGVSRAEDAEEVKPMVGLLDLHEGLEAFTASMRESDSRLSDRLMLDEEVLDNLSHELKTPLASIQACAEMLSEEDLEVPDTRRELCFIVQDQAIRLSHMIDDVLSCSMMEAGVTAVIREEVDLEGLIDDVILAMTPLAQEKSIFLVHEGERTGVKVWADKQLLYQALMNLLSNALKYSGCGGSVRLRSFGSGSRYCGVEVRDEGVGIPSESLSQIFEKYYRVESHSHMANGTGLGLNLVRQIVETLHRGTIEVESELGKGSVFTVYLPLRGETVSIEGEMIALGHDRQVDADGRVNGSGRAQ